jgi:hypothetical protein
MNSLTTERTVTREYLFLSAGASFATILAISLRATSATAMCGVAFSIYFFFKIATFIASRNVASTKSALAYLLLWPGMNPRQFFVRKPVTTNNGSAWFQPVLTAILGAFFLWIVVPALPGRWVILKGWMGLAGFALLLHFGTFQLAAKYFQSRGRAVVPVMNAPWRASSLSDFWANRWNTAFNHLVEFCGAAKVARRLGASTTLFLVFLASGLVHDLVISVPARGGFGGPTLYFLIQAVGILSEKRARHFMKARPVLSRAWVYIVVLGPAPLLFHPPFLERVIVPLVTAIQL